MQPLQPLLTDEPRPGVHPAVALAVFATTPAEGIPLYQLDQALQELVDAYRQDVRRGLLPPGDQADIPPNERQTSTAGQDVAVPRRPDRQHSQHQDSAADRARTAQAGQR